MQSYHSAHTPLRRASSLSHNYDYAPQTLNEQIMGGASPYAYQQPGFAGSHHPGLGLHGVGTPYPPNGMALPPQSGYMGGPYMEGGHPGTRLSGDLHSSPSNIIPLSSPPDPRFQTAAGSRNFIQPLHETHQTPIFSDSYDEYEDGYTHYGRSPYSRSRRLSSPGRYYSEYDDYDRSPYYSSRGDRSPRRYSSSRYQDPYYSSSYRDRRYDYYRDDMYDRRDHYRSRHYSSGGHKGPNGESIMYRRTRDGDVQVLRNGKESFTDKCRRALGLDPKGVHIVRLKPGESLVDPRGRSY